MRDIELPSAELHLHTCYSFLEGASQPEELVDLAAALGYRALAVTDHDGLYGAMTFAQACAAADIRPITGVEITLRHGLVDPSLERVHLTLLAETDRGYANICRLVTAAHRATLQPDGLPADRWLPPPNRPPVMLDPDLLAEHAEGIIALSGCRSGEVARLIDAGRLDDAEAALRALARLFSRQNTFVEVQHNLVKGDTQRCARLYELAQRLGLPPVATGNVHYHERSRHRLQDALVAVKHRSTLEASHRVRRPNSEFFLRSPRETAAVFAAYPEALRNVNYVSERCRDFNLARREFNYDFPDFTRQDGERHATADDVLADYCRSKFDERYPPDRTAPAIVDKARGQLEDELKLVAKHHLSGFFLIYRDLQQMATEVAQEVRGAGTVRGGSGLPPGRGRGSSVSSIICYLIGLSHVDPVKNRLFFRRFLNEDLQSVPDIDLDFARDIREQLILRVYETYGHDHAALVCTYATYHLRSAVRDLGKALGLPPAAIDKLAKLSEGGGADTVRRELARLPDFMGQADGPLWDLLVELAEQVNGFPRHVGQHVGGMVISSRPLVELVPVQPSSLEGRYICQWDKDGCDDARFIKIDFLALGMLSLVEECLELIWQTRGEKLDLSAISYEDPAVYDAICAGDTVGMFQIESRAQIQMLTRSQPRNLDDLAVQVAIVRPGPIVGGAVNPYVRRREQMRRDPTFVPQADHPLLNKLLADTLGVVLYQDQVLEVAIELAGFTAGQADQFRRSMSRRRSREAMERFRDPFLRGAMEKGVEPEKAVEIFARLCGFSEFGFPKSHAYAFAVLAYQSAWLRHSYAPEFLAALLNNQPMGFYAPHVLINDGKRRGIQALRVAINRSQPRTIPMPPPKRKEPVPQPLGDLREHPSAEAAAPPQSPWGGSPSRGLGTESPIKKSTPPPAGGGRGVVPSHSQWGPGGASPPKPGDNGSILLGLNTVRGLSEDLADEIVHEREKNGPYRSLADLLRRVALPRTVAENLVAIGALSDFGLGRRELLWQLGLLLPAASPTNALRLPALAVQSAGRDPATRSRPAARRPSVARSRQPGLDLPTEQDMVSLPDMDDWTRMVADYGLLGLSPSYHPMGLMRPSIPADVLTNQRLKVTRDGARVRTAGLVVCRQRPGTAKGFLFLLLEDETGLTNVVVKPDLYETCRTVARAEPYLLVEGTVQHRSGSLNVMATGLAPLQRVPGNLLPVPPTRFGSPPGHPSDRHADPEAIAGAAEAEARRLPVPASHNFH